MSGPYFSLVIPTKNRAFLMPLVIDSILRQTCPDFEVIVADNDDTDATAQAMGQFADPRITHLKTGGLSMPDNWEAGISKAKGRYICMLEDKQALKRSALERLHQEAERHQPMVIKWAYDTFEDGAPPVRLRLTPATAEKPYMVTSDSLLKAFCTDRSANYKAVLPLPQQSAIHRDLARKIREGLMGRLFHPVSPDVVLSLVLLAHADEVLDMASALGVYTSTTHSNGSSSAVKGDLFKQFLRELGIDEARLYDKVPLKTINIPGSIFNDFLHMQEKLGGRLARHGLSWTKFFFESQQAIWLTASRGVDVSENQRSWDTAFAEQSEQVRQETLAALAPSKNQATAHATPWRRITRQIGFNQLERRIKAFVRGRLKGQLEWRFRSVGEYLEWDAAQSERSANN
ncbi:MAG: glycosyltransferase family 2 protein [Limisphaerales bacterium]